MLGLLIILALGPAIGARPQQAPSASPQPTGTGRITVHVVADNNGAPIKRARVVLSGMAAPPRSGARPGQVSSALSFTTNLPGTPQRDSNIPPEMAARRVSQTGETDETGTCSFTQLPAGSFSLMVTPEAGFVRPTRPQSVRLEDGEAQAFTIRLQRTGAITGRISDDGGDPVVRAQVRALRRDAGTSGGRLMMSSSGSTDDLGQFRLFDVQPGEYFVMAQYPVFRMPPGDVRTGLGPTFYPGVTTLDAARAVIVHSGEDTPADFSLARVAMANVSGNAFDSQGAPLKGSVSIQPRGEVYATGQGVGVNPDGSFVIRGIPPGNYYVTATLSRGNGPDAYREGADVPVTVNGDDVTVNIRTNPGATVSGRVVFEGEQSVPGSVTLSRNGVTTRTKAIVTAQPPSDEQRLPSASFIGSVPIRDDNTFELTGVRGRILVQASGNGVLKAVLLGGQDITGKPLNLVGTERIDDLVIVLTTDTGSLEGIVSDVVGRASGSVWVVALPDDPLRWSYNAGFLRTTTVLTEAPTQAQAMTPQPGIAPPPPALTPAQQAMRWTPVVGGFFIPRLLPGRYWVVAYENANGPMRSDRQQLEKLKGRATSVTIVAGQKTTVELALPK